MEGCGGCLEGCGGCLEGRWRKVVKGLASYKQRGDVTHKRAILHRKKKQELLTDAVALSKKADVTHNRAILHRKKNC